MKQIAILLMIILSVANGFSQTKNFIDQPYIETRVKVDTLISPDRIYLNILISEKDTKGKTSVEEFENKMAKKLVSMGIDLKKQLILNDLASNFKKYFLRRQDILKSKSYSVIVYDALTAGRVIVALEEIGISNVQLDKTEYSKIEELKLILKTKAIIKAKNQAETLLEPLNQKLGKALYIADMNSYNNYNLDVRRKGVQAVYELANDQKFEPIAIDFQKIKIQCEIHVKFKIE